LRHSKIRHHDYSLRTCLRDVESGMHSSDAEINETMRISAVELLGKRALIRALVALFVYTAITGCIRPVSRGGPTLPLRVGVSSNKDGRLTFSSATVLGKTYNESTKAERILHPFGGYLWPGVWRFRKELVGIHDDAGNVYDPGSSWRFQNVKGGTRYLAFDIIPNEHAKQLCINIILVVNDRRFHIKETFIKTPDNKWIKVPKDRDGTVPTIRKPPAKEP